LVVCMLGPQQVACLGDMTESQQVASCIHPKTNISVAFLTSRLM